MYVKIFQVGTTHMTMDQFIFQSILLGNENLHYHEAKQIQIIITQIFYKKYSELLITSNKRSK